MAGRYAGIVNACSVEFEASRDMTASWEDILECLKVTYSMCCITQAYTKGLIFHREQIEKALHIGFSNATKIANSLVLEGKMAFRLAHKIVGGAWPNYTIRVKARNSLPMSYSIPGAKR